MAHPDFALRTWETGACAPLVTTGARLATAKARLLAPLHHTLTTEPDLHLRVDGRRIDGERDGATTYFRLSGVARDVRLISRVMVPAHVVAHSEDHRRLGVAVRRLVIDGRDISPAHPCHRDGWHAAEEDWRWTDGAAAIPAAGALHVDVTTAPVGLYRPGAPPTPQRYAARA